MSYSSPDSVHNNRICLASVKGLSFLSVCRLGIREFFIGIVTSFTQKENSLPLFAFQISRMTEEKTVLIVCAQLVYPNQKTCLVQLSCMKPCSDQLMIAMMRSYSEKPFNEERWKGQLLCRCEVEG